jgi:hypothetical protein
VTLLVLNDKPQQSEAKIVGRKFDYLGRPWQGVGDDCQGGRNCDRLVGVPPVQSTPESERLCAPTRSSALTGCIVKARFGDGRATSR